MTNVNLWRLQDTMGGKLYPAVLAHLQEPDDDALKAEVLNQAAEAVPVLVGLLGRIQPVVAAAM